MRKFKIMEGPGYKEVRLDALRPGDLCRLIGQGTLDAGALVMYLGEADMSVDYGDPKITVKSYIRGISMFHFGSNKVCRQPCYYFTGARLVSRL